MSKRYVVPQVAQPSSDTCWHASSQMIWWYWQGQTGRQGPMNTLGDSFSENKPIVPAQFVYLAQKVGMKKVPGKIEFLTEQNLTDMLTKYGPLWCAGYWFGVGHIVVLTGVDARGVYFNDPDGGVPKTNTVAWFNLKLAKNVDGCLMYKDPAAY